MPIIVELTTTVETQEQAESLAKSILELRLAACVQYTPIRSSYWWKEEICSSHEIRCSMKTTDACQNALVGAVQRIHPYEVPEILLVKIDDCGESYMSWLQEQIRSP